MKKILLLLLIPVIALAQFGPTDGTIKGIDEIRSQSKSDIVLNPNDKVDINYFTGEKALQSTADGELEESPITNAELGQLTGIVENVQDSLNLKALKATNINVTAPITGGGDLSLDRTIGITQSSTTVDGFISSTDWNTFNDKQPAITGTDGDLLIWSTTLTNLSIGSLGQLLTVDALGFPSWQDAPISTTLDTKGQLQGFTTENANVGPCVDDQILIYDDLESTGWKCSDVPAQSPTTTENDIIVRGVTEDERLAVGTDGQLLTVVAGDVAWAEPPVSTTLDTKGDIQTFTTENAKLAVGLDDQMIYADSTQPTGLRWDDQPISTTVSQKGDIQTHDGIENQSQTVGTNGTFLMSDDQEPNGLRWYDAIQTTDWDDTPIGTILAYGSMTPPTGYLLADGACVDKAEYGSLFKIIGIDNGECDAGSGAATGFNLPDLITLNRFIRAADGTTLSPGDLQSDATAVNGLSADQAGHKHTNPLPTTTDSRYVPWGYVSTTVTAYATFAGGTGRRGYTSTTDPAITLASTDTETRPNSIAMAYIIKAKGRDPITSVAQKSMSPDKAGFVIWSAFDGNIEGHLKADGSCVLKETWPDYVENVGLSTFGECTITTTNDGVLLPDLITGNRFIRSAGGSLAVGTTQSSENKSHQHSTSTSSAAQRIAFYATVNPTNNPGSNNSNVLSGGSSGIQAITGAQGTSESRPNNMALVPFVRMVDRDVIYGNFDQIEEHTIVEDATTLHRLEVKSQYNTGSAATTVEDQDSIVYAYGWDDPYAIIYVKKSIFTEAPKLHCSYGADGNFNLGEYPTCSRNSANDTANGWAYKFFNYRTSVGYATRHVDLYFTKTKADQDRNRVGIVVKEKAVQGFQIGDCKISILGDAAFNQLHTGSWAKMSGQSIAGTELESIGGFSTMPDATTNGAFLRQVGGNSGALRAFQADQLASHRHTVGGADHTSSGTQGFDRPNNVSPVRYVNTSYTGGNETRPDNISVNFYCRID